MRADLLAEDRRLRNRRRMLAALGASTAIAMLAMLPRENALTRWFLVAQPPPPVATVRPVPHADSTPPSATVPPAPTAALRTRPLSAWLSDVARDAGRDLVVSPELRGDLTASETRDLDWKQRLEAYARVFGFEFAVSDGLIEVRRAGAETRAVRAETARADGPAGAMAEVPPAAAASPAPQGHESGSASAKPDAPPSPPAPPPQTRVVRLAYATAKDAAAVVSKTGTALDVTATADPSANVVVLSGQPAAISRVAGVIGELDRPRRRILLEAKIVEVLRSARLDLGVEWKITGSTVGGDVRFPPPASDAGSAALLIATHGAAALDARISALEAGGKLHIVSRPSVVMVEGSPATIESVRILRIRLPSSGTVVGDEVVASPTGGRATEDIPVGVRLEVTPAIRGGGQILLRIKAKSSSLGAPLPPDNIPEELSRMVDAEVLVTSGETAVLGGLTREADTKSGAGVPGLRRVPGLGALFGRKSNATEDEELLVIVTPRVLD